MLTPFLYNIVKEKQNAHTIMVILVNLIMRIPNLQNCALHCYTTQGFASLSYIHLLRTLMQHWATK